MKVAIRYQAQYLYGEPVSFSPHVFRLFPKAGTRLTVHRVALQTNADALVTFRRDIFDNEVASAFYPRSDALLAANLELDLDVQEWNAFDFLLSSHALAMPFTYTPGELHSLRPFLSDAPGPVLPFWKVPASPRPTVETLVGLNDAIHRGFAYERRDEGEAFLPEETLARGAGACRDFAVLLAAVLRGLGIAARLASGYLCEFGEGEKRAEGSLHAWVEAYLPGAGWVGMDPTNGTFCDHHHLTAAVGLTPADIAPIAGTYYHDTRVTSLMSASLQVIPQ
jgi:transglutaminase-like putative cysteine protease